MVEMRWDLAGPDLLHTTATVRTEEMDTEMAISETKEVLAITFDNQGQIIGIAK